MASELRIPNYVGTSEERECSDSLSEETPPMNTIVKLVNALRQREQGATAIEYGLIASLIAVVIIAGATAVGTGVAATFTNVAGHL